VERRQYAGSGQAGKVPAFQKNYGNQEIKTDFTGSPLSDLSDAR
jgi:hypothetical protein